jgi:hypothetical protein
MYNNRLELYASLKLNISKVKIINGNNNGKEGIVTYKSKPNNNVYYSKYIRYQFCNYFSLKVKVGEREISTSCNNIVLV